MSPLRFGSPRAQNADPQRERAQTHALQSPLHIASLTPACVRVCVHTHPPQHCPLQRPPCPCPGCLPASLGLRAALSVSDFTAFLEREDQGWRRPFRNAPPPHKAALGRWAESKYVNKRHIAPCWQGRWMTARTGLRARSAGQILQGGRTDPVACRSDSTFKVFTIVVIIITCVVLKKNLNS